MPKHDQSHNDHMPTLVNLQNQYILQNHFHQSQSLLILFHPTEAQDPLRYETQVSALPQSAGNIRVSDPGRQNAYVHTAPYHIQTHLNYAET